MPDDPRAIVHQWFERVWNQGDASAIDELLAANARIHGLKGAIGSDVGGLAEPVRRFGAGLVVAPGDVEGLAVALRTVLDDPEPFREGARRARAELTWDASAAAHLALYEELL